MTDEMKHIKQLAQNFRTIQAGSRRGWRRAMLRTYASKSYPDIIHLNMQLLILQFNIEVALLLRQQLYRPESFN